MKFPGTVNGDANPSGCADGMRPLNDSPFSGWGK
jgi:hypothetical protein